MPLTTISRALCLVGLTLTVVAGCGTPAEPADRQNVAQTRTSTPSPSPTVPTKAYTVEELAAAVGCTPKFQGNPSDYRQAVCETAQYKYVLLDFATAQGQKDWLDYSLMYGGIYLVGDRWLLSASSKEHMVELSKTLGGTIEERASMTTG